MTSTTKEKISRISIYVYLSICALFAVLMVIVAPVLIILYTA